MVRESIKAGNSQRDYSKQRTVTSVIAGSVIIPKSISEVTVRTQFCWFTVTLLFCLLSPRILVAQASSQFPPSNSTTSQGPQDDELKKWKKDATKKANKERQAEIQKDTEKLLQLATELKEYVGRSDENVLSINVVKKADEIEKLAHSVKEKMKTSY
jgi:hypothetical protein